MKLLNILAVAILLFNIGCTEDDEPTPARPDIDTEEPDGPDDPDGPDPEEGLTKWDFNDITDGWVGVTESHIKDGNLVFVQAPAAARQVVKTPVKTFGAGTYKWRVNIPVIEKDAQFHIGLGLFNVEVAYQPTESAKAYFLIGYGKDNVRDPKGATEDQVIAYISSAGQPLIEDQIPIDIGWNEFEFRVVLNEEEKYTISWVINDEVVKVSNMWYGPEVLFEVMCETGCYGFVGTTAGTQSHEVLFDYVSYDVREAPTEPETTEPEEVDGVRTWNFDNLDFWAYAHQGDNLELNQCDITDGVLRIFTRAGKYDRKKVKTLNQKYTSGRYKWSVYVPQMGTGDQASIGAFLYSDDTHELDFEIGYGTTTLRTELGATANQMVAYTTTQANPWNSTKHLIDAEAWYDLEIDLELVNGDYLAKWYIDGIELESVQLTYGSEVIFSIFCSVENITFMGDHTPKQENYGKFDYVSYEFHR